MKAAIGLKEKIARRELTLGIIITNHLWLELLEIARFADLDYVLIDLEHLDHGETLVSDACRMGRMMDFPVLVRPPRTDRESIRLAMDLGPCGLLLPMIETLDQIDEIQNGLWMPPRGERRPGGHGNWWVSDFNYESWKSEVEDNFITLMQIESPLGLKNAQAIAEHPVTTAMAVGPYDLSARLGVCWQPDSPLLKEGIATIRRAAEAAGKPMWAIGDAQNLAEQGFHFLCIAEPSNLLKATLKQLSDGLRAGVSTRGEVPEAFVP